MSNSAEFLVELEEKESLVVMQKCINSFAELMIKTDSSPQAYAARISKVENEEVILETSFGSILAQFTDLVTIKFFIGTEVYFIKTKLSHNEGILSFSEKAAIIQLKRRKEERYNLPEKWTQMAAVWSIQLKTQNKARIVDISNSGIRFEVPDLGIPVNKGDQIRIQFKIHKRSEVVCDAIVRFKLKKQNDVHILGLEFVRLQDSHKSRIRSVVDDIIIFNSMKPLA